MIARQFQNIVVFTVAMYFTHFVFAFQSQYPKDREQEQREEMGSLFGTDGIELTKFNSNNNQKSSKLSQKKSEKSRNVENYGLNKSKTDQTKYILQAIIKTLNHAPISIIDTENGIFVTDWFDCDGDDIKFSHSKDRDRNMRKITILIKDGFISDNSIEIFARQRIKNKNRWVEKSLEESDSYFIKNKIIQEARNLATNQKELRN